MSGVEDRYTNQFIKQDSHKLNVADIPFQIIWDSAEVRKQNEEKYPDPNSWKEIPSSRIAQALARHFLRWVDDPYGVDDEDGIPHYKHLAWNMTTYCAQRRIEDSETNT